VGGGGKKENKEERLSIGEELGMKRKKGKSNNWRGKSRKRRLKNKKL